MACLRCANEARGELDSATVEVGGSTVSVARCTNRMACTRRLIEQVSADAGEALMGRVVEAAPTLHKGAMSIDMGEDLTLWVECIDGKLRWGVDVD